MLIQNIGLLIKLLSYINPNLITLIQQAQSQEK